MKRRDGNTTRTIDHAIQILFKVGAIKIPTTIREEEGCSWYEDQLIFDPACTCEDASIANIQKELSTKIKRRLELEHKNIKFDFYSNIIRLK